jgi:hypothetical protein
MMERSNLFFCHTDPDERRTVIFGWYENNHHPEMYLRDSKGRLKWFPPASQGLDPFADPGGPSYAMQYAMIRQQMQQEEWMRFHAPPTGDQVHFQTKAPAEYVAVRPPVSMGQRISIGHNPTGRSFNEGNYLPFGSGPAPRPHLELPHPSPRLAAHVIRNPTPTPPMPRNVRSAPTPNEEDFPPDGNVSCMNTLFGAQVKQHHRSVSGTMLCNQAYPLSTPELDIKLPSHYHMARLMPDETNNTAVPIPESTKPSNPESTKPSNPMQLFLCNGVRGPPKKFDYSFKPAMPQCHGNSDVFYDALQEETLGTGPPVEQDVLSVHDSFDDKTFLMDVDIVTSQPQRKKKGQWRENIARGKSRKDKKALESTIEECRPPVESMDSIEAARKSPNENLVVNLTVQRQPIPYVHEPPPKVVEELDILSEDSKDAMYASVTNRKKPSPINVFHQFSDPTGAFISPTDIIQKIASEDIFPSPVRVLENKVYMTPNQEYPIEPKSVSFPEKEPHWKSRSRRPKTGSKSKSRRGKSSKKVRDAELSAKDQAALAQSIREICLRATPELNGEDYPSFDEPKDGQGSDIRPGRDSPDSETSGSGGENKQHVANEEEKRERRSKKEKLKRSAAVKPLIWKESKDVKHRSALQNRDRPDDVSNQRE